MFVAVGNSPSSGSTFLGDLLDSSPVSLCGSELNIFTNEKIYSDFQGFKKNPFSCSVSTSLYITRNCLNRDYLFEYALNEDNYLELLDNSNNAADFFEQFGQRFGDFRSRSGAIWFEKTPQNISVMDKFLTEFPDNYFLHIVRSPIFVIPSLIKRGFSPGVACYTWLFEVAKYIANENEKTVLIKYEDFVDKPWDIVSSIITTISGDAISSKVIEDGYLNNNYRRHVDKNLPTWKINQFGKGPKNANKKIISESILRMIKKAMELRISDSWAKRYNIPAISLRDAIDHFGYLSEVESMLSHVDAATDTIFTFQDMRFLTKKFLYSKLTCDTCSAPIIQIVERI